MSGNDPDLFRRRSKFNAGLAGMAAIDRVFTGDQPKKEPAKAAKVIPIKNATGKKRTRKST